MTNINVLIVTPDASHISFQSDSWDAARREIARMSKDVWFNGRMNNDSPVFMRDTTKPHGVMMQRTVGQVLSALEAK